MEERGADADDPQNTQNLNAAGAAAAPGFEVPQELKDRISTLRGSEPVLLEETKVTADAYLRLGNPFLIPIQDVIQQKILTDYQREFLGRQGATINATCIGPSLDESKIYILKPDNFNYGLTGWDDLIANNNLTAGTQLQLWSFKKIFQLGFAMLRKNDSHENQETFPEELQNWINSFGGSKAVFLAEKTLLKTDKNQYFSLRIDRMANEYLKAEEKLAFAPTSKGEHFNVVLIGSSADHIEYGVKLRKRSVYALEGPNWKRFVGDYKLDAGMKVRLWAFRKPVRELENNCPEPGFAWVVGAKEEGEQ